MIKRLSEKIADKMNCEGTIQSEDIAAYSYSIEITLATIINFISIAVIAILFGRIISALFGSADISSSFFFPSMMNASL